MQRLRDRYALARLRAVIDDGVDAAGLERREHIGIHLRAVGLEPDGVVIEKGERDEIEILDLGGTVTVELGVDASDVFHHRLLQPLTPFLFGEAENELGIFAVDLARVANHARQKLGGVAGAGC